MYRVKVKQGIWRCHAHQLRINKSENTDETNEDQSHAELVMTQANTHSEINSPQRGLTLQLKQGGVY